jgi:hypothetical protein
MFNINLLNRNSLTTLVAGLLMVGSSSVLGNPALNRDEINLENLLPDIVESPCEVGECPLPEPLYYFTPYCKLYSPSQVHRYELLCENATYLNVYIRDAAAPSSDHWRATVQANNAFESIAVTESGPNFSWGAPARVYNGYPTPPAPTYLKAAIGCRYVADGVNPFIKPNSISPQLLTGWAQLAFTSNGRCRFFDHGVHFDEPDAH